jgi:putative FmdB family regulatory protein
MPIYDYECRNCEAKVSDVFQKVTDPELTTCPKCFSESGLFRVVTGGLHSFMAGSNTVGSVADRNTKINKNKINEMEAMKRESQPKVEKPWHHEHTTKSMSEINKMSNDQKTRYIMEGK